MSDVKAQEPAAKDEPGDGVPAPLTAAAKSRSSRTASNGTGAHATNGNRNGAPTATRAALDRDELTALVETVQRTIEAAPSLAPEGPDALELDDRAERGHLLDRPPPPRPLAADRRAKLLASLARRAEEVALAEERDAAPARTVRRPSTAARRLLAVLALLAPAAAVVVMLMTDASNGELSRADAAFVSGQLVAADQRLRAQLVRVPANGTAVAVARAREAELTTRSLAIEVRGYGGPEATRLRRALRLEREWIAAVGSTLKNPRSELRSELFARGALARDALEALPGPSGKRLGGVRSLVSYALSRVRATGAETP